MLHILTEMRAFRVEVAKNNKEFTNSLNTYSEWVQENSDHIKSIDTKLSKISQEIETIRQENCNLKKENEQLTRKVVDLEQLLRDNVVEIYGVPYKKEEDVMKIITDISHVIDFNFDPGMIDNCYRIKSATADPAKPGSIHVKFLRKLDKERFIAKRRQKRNVNSSDLGYLGNASPVYVKESLTPDKRKLLNAARTAQREKRYTFIWVKNGRIMLRKKEGERPVVVNTFEDIAKLA